MNRARQGRGRVAIVDPSLPPSQWQFEGPFFRNLQLYDSATILAQLVRRDPAGKPWHLGIAYIEFENNGGAAVSVPVASRDGGRSYYDNLSLSATRDYLRAVLMPPAGSILGRCPLSTRPRPSCTRAATWSRSTRIRLAAPA